MPHINHVALGHCTQYLTFRFLLYKRGIVTTLPDLLCRLEVQRGTQHSEQWGKMGWGRGLVLWLLLPPREAGDVFKLGGCLDNPEAKTSLRKDMHTVRKCEVYSAALEKKLADHMT